MVIPQRPVRADRDELAELRKQELRKKIAQGLESLDLGEGIDGGEFFAQLERDEASLGSKPRPAA